MTITPPTPPPPILTIEVPDLETLDTAAYELLRDESLALWMTYPACGERFRLCSDDGTAICFRDDYAVVIYSPTPAITSLLDVLTAREDMPPIE